MALSASTSVDEQDVVSLWPGRRAVLARPGTVSRSSRSRCRGHGYRRGQIELSEPYGSFAKRVLDVIGASFGLLLLAPLFITIAVIIKMTSPGPVFFTQYRYGRRNRLFRIYKFRTMHTHLSDATGVRQTTEVDPRVTPIGRVLRLTSLDELPQLINVVKGHMSLVGPRPHVPGMLAGGELYEDLVPFYFQRHAVRPGITGLAQVSGCRGSTTEAESAIARVAYDLEYVERWSFWMDVRIIVRTIRQEFLSGTGI